MHCFGSGCRRLSCQTLSSATPFKCSLIIVKKVVGIELVESDDIDLNRWIINKLF